MPEREYDSPTCDRSTRPSRSSEAASVRMDGEIPNETSRSHRLVNVLLDEVEMLRNVLGPVLMPFPKDLNDSKNPGRSTDLGSAIASANDLLERSINDLASIRGAVAL